MSTLHWGILGTGNIARQFATGVAASRRGRLAAVGSRSIDSARAFAHTYQIPHARGSYDQVIADRAVNVIYVALPNTLHRDWTIKALRAGKHVLCEKPIASNAAEAEEMFEVAAQTGRVLVEAFMFRAHPLTHAVVNAVRSGAIGQVRLIRTSFCYRTRRIDDNIRFDPALAGGALMDIGCYCINFSRLIAGADPLSIYAIGQKHGSGIDEVVAGMLGFPGGTLASFTCGMSVQADNSASICGTEGYIETPVPWKPPAQGATYTIAHSTPPKQDLAQGKAALPPPRQTFNVDAGIDLYGVEVDDFAATVLDGKPPMMSRDESISTMRVLDEMRRQIGVIG